MSKRDEPTAAASIRSIGEAMGRAIYGDEWDAVQQRQHEAIEQALHDAEVERRRRRALSIATWAALVTLLAASWAFTVLLAVIVVKLVRA